MLYLGRRHVNLEYNPLPLTPPTLGGGEGKVQDEARKRDCHFDDAHLETRVCYVTHLSEGDLRVVAPA